MRRHGGERGYREGGSVGFVGLEGRNAGKGRILLLGVVHEARGEGLGHGDDEDLEIAEGTGIRMMELVPEKGSR
ncbi:hypothetical protein CC2G_014009 [Coprinopsis cinerea AmutBmut pab1-1]|jgi:hypothetical protein|nr:hypothetical protein CC2G_014009 [Coprinopsis cinerea AmutBmut pab1-1]